jgi:hypothetical protein
MPSGTRQRSGVSLLLGSPMSILRVTRSEGDPPQGIGGALSIRGLIPHQKAQDQLNQVARSVSFEMIGCPSISRRLLSDATSEHSFGCSAGTHLPSRPSWEGKLHRAERNSGQGWKCPWTPPKSKTSGLTRLGEPHLIYCSPKVRRKPDMDQEHKSTTLSAVECCPSLEP